MINQPNKTSTVDHPALSDASRIIVISDIHGNLAYLRGLVDKLALRADDQLVLLGDLVEKGPESMRSASLPTIASTAIRRARGSASSNAQHLLSQHIAISRYPPSLTRSDGGTFAVQSFPLRPS